MRGVWLGWVLILAGCAAPERPRVWVDVSSTTPPVLAGSTEVDRTPFSPPLGTLGAMPGSRLSTGVTEPMVREATEKIAADRQRSLDRIRDIATNVRDDRLEREEEVIRAEREAFRFSAMASLTDESRIIFERYAEEVGRLTRRIARYRDFPDDGRDPEPRDEVDRRRQAEIDAARAELATLDARYKRDMQRLDLEIEPRLAEFDLAARRRLLELEKRLEADREVLQGLLQVGPAPLQSGQTAERLQTNLPPVGPRTVPLPRVPSATVRFPAPPPPRQTREQRWREAQIWASLQGYELVEDPKQGENKTAEFRSWKSKRERGIWANSPPR